jgi:hypothetical protein
VVLREAIAATDPRLTADLLEDISYAKLPPDRQRALATAFLIADLRDYPPEDEDD